VNGSKLKTRIIGVVLVKDGIAVQSIGFQRYLPVGTPEIAVNYLDRWGIDEIIILQIDATAEGSAVNVDRVRSCARQCQVPLSVGGGITAVSDIKAVIQAGADKVVINSALVADPELISKAAALFGSQCVVVSIDARRQPDGTYLAYTHGGRRVTGCTPQQLAQRAELLGAGEIFLTSIDHDGRKLGYDLDLLKTIVRAVHIPVIVSGGAGHPEHMQAAMRSGVSAVAAANLFHFTEHSVIAVKRYLSMSNEPVRLDSYVAYEGRGCDRDGRFAKRDDAELEALRFHYIPEEHI